MIKKRVIEIKRKYFGDNYTSGDLFIDGVFFCNTLEDRVRNLSTEQKVPHQTAIPTGEYEVTLARSPRFGRVLPRLHNVPYFEGILIHAGNTAGDTSGCILVGEGRTKGRVENSRHWEQELIKQLEGCDKIKIVVR